MQTWPFMYCYVKDSSAENTWDFFHIYVRLLIDFENSNKYYSFYFYSIKNVAFAFVYSVCLLQSVGNDKLRKLFLKKVTVGMESQRVVPALDLTWKGAGSGNRCPQL